MTDISSFFNSFMSLILSFVSFVYDTLDSISFMGISLLDFFTTLLILNVAVPLVITLVKNRPERRSKGNSNEKES